MILVLLFLAIAGCVIVKILVQKGKMRDPLERLPAKVRDPLERLKNWPPPQSPARLPAKATPAGDGEAREAEAAAAEKAKVELVSVSRL